MKNLIITLVALASIPSTSFARDEVVAPEAEPAGKLRQDPKDESLSIQAEIKRAKQSPSYPKFVQLFAQCTTKELASCEPYHVFSYFRPPTVSCLGSGNSLNWKSIQCEVKGQKKIFPATSKEFETIAVCMKSKNGPRTVPPTGTMVRYREDRQGPESFTDFAFFSIGCRLPNGKYSW